MKQCATCLGLLLAAVALAHAGEAPAFKMSAEETKLLELTNQERKKKELKPLRPSPELFKIARAHSENMAKQHKMEHILDGKTPFDRMRAAKYAYRKGGENIAACEASIGLPEVMRAWMESKAHRDNILLPDFTDVGLGFARDKEGQVYYTQLFAKPQSKE